MTTTAAQVRRFPMDGFADTCIGYARPEHGADVVDDDSVLCEACARALNAAVSADREQARHVSASAGCGNWCHDHAHGTRYYDCMCCYGD